MFPTQYCAIQAVSLTNNAKKVLLLSFLESPPTKNLNLKMHRTAKSLCFCCKSKTIFCRQASYYLIRPVWNMLKRECLDKSKKKSFLMKQSLLNSFLNGTIRYSDIHLLQSSLSGPTLLHKRWYIPMFTLATEFYGSEVQLILKVINKNYK